MVLAVGSRLSLSQGAVEVTLPSGVEALVQAPAHLILEREDRIYLKHGIARFRVPPEGAGFQVRSPEMLVTDFGTEFGIISGSGGSDEVHVFKGSVKVERRRGV